MCRAVEASNESGSQSRQRQSQDDEPTRSKEERTVFMGLADFKDPEFQSALKDYWRKTLLEIRNLGPRINMTSPAASGGYSFYSQWKQLLDDSQISPFEFASNRRKSMADEGRSVNETNMLGSNESRPRYRRFEGFLSWDRLVQEWTDEIQEYLDKIQDESLASGEYPMSNFGFPREVIQAESSSVAAVESLLDDDLDSISVISPSTTTSKKVTLPNPKPAAADQEVLPHTSLADPAKRIWIVTTASLPWRTGTAVNPLLRAAYLCSQRRTEAGGSVTLMLPWLERPADQERVYGKSKGFETKENQTEFIRCWLRESAGLILASEQLDIEWYTAWQNPVENSLYSMGDITALIPEDACDIMILEEPVSKAASPDVRFLEIPGN
jgi:hypothetical protein